MSTKGTQDHDLWLGRRALKKGLIDGHQLTEALLVQSKTGLRKPLDQVLLERKALTPDAIAELKDELSAQRTQKHQPNLEEKADERKGQIFLKVLCDEVHSREPFLTTYLGRLPRDPEPVRLHLLPKTALREGLWLDFLEVVRAAQNLDHPNLVKVLDVDTLEAHFAIVTRHSRGALTLSSLLQRVRRLKMSEALRITREIAQGLAALHEAKLTHKDLRPERVVLSPAGAVQLDLPGVAFTPAGAAAFGIASMIHGTPHWIAPEALKGSGSLKSDVYALGVVAYELVTGVRPFEGSDLEDLGPQHLNQAPIPPHQVMNALPKEVGELLTWMLSKSAKSRPSAGQVVDAVTELESTVKRSGLTQKFQAFNPNE